MVSGTILGWITLIIVKKRSTSVASLNYARKTSPKKSSFVFRSSDLPHL